MPDLSFRIEGAEAVHYAASPLLALKLRIGNVPAEEHIHAIMLRCQVQIEVTRRRYTAQDQARLTDLFGEPGRWNRTLRSMLWTHANALVPPFTGQTLIDLQLPCTYDFNVSAAKYFYALRDGEVPLCLLLSGTVFYKSGDGNLQVAQVPWEKEATYRMSIRVWQEVMDHYYPNSAWLSLQKDAFDRLYRYKSARGLATWEQALDSLLSSIEESVVE